MDKVFCYVRVSGDSQLQGDGFPRQIQACRDHATRNGLKISKFFREEAISGTTDTLDRPAWTAMMEALHSNSVRTILIEKLDRLSRSLLIQEATIAELLKQRFKLISVHEPELMSDDPTRVAFRQMMGVFAQYDKTQIVLKLRAARQRIRLQNGRCEGRKPYGTRDGEQEVLDRMKAWRSGGMSFNRIAAQLNDARITPRLSRRWHAYTVSKILSRA